MQYLVKSQEAIDLLDHQLRETNLVDVTVWEIKIRSAQMVQIQHLKHPECCTGKGDESKIRAHANTFRLSEKQIYKKISSRVS